MQRCSSCFGEVLAGTIILGGLVPSDLVILWDWLVVIGAPITTRAAFLVNAGSRCSAGRDG